MIYMNFFDNKDLDINIAKIPLNILVKDELKPEKTLKGEKHTNKDTRFYSVL